MNLKTSRSDLLTFGFIGRDYKKDTSALKETVLNDDLSSLDDAILSLQALI